MVSDDVRREFVATLLSQVLDLVPRDRHAYAGVVVTTIARQLDEWEAETRQAGAREAYASALALARAEIEVVIAQEEAQAALNAVWEAHVRMTPRVLH